MDNVIALLLGGFVVLIGILLYFVPWVVAARRNHPQLAAIAVLNLLLGWTLLGWVAALVWAVTKSTQPQH